MNISYSKLILFDQCPSAWAARYLQHVPEIPTRPLESGRMIAKFCEYYRRYLQKRQLESDLLAVDDIVNAIFVEAGVDLKQREVETTEVFKDVHYVARSFARTYKHDFEATFGIEMFLSRNLIPSAENAPAVDVIGFADHVRLYEDKTTKGPVILFEDDKSSWDATVTSANDFQLDIYDWMGEPKYENYQVASRINFIRHNIQSKVRILSPNDLEILRRRMSVIYSRMTEARREHFYPARPGEQCSYCPIAPGCAKKNALVHNGQIVADQSSAEECLGDMLVLEAALKQREKQLKAYAKVNGPVRVGGKEAGFGGKRSIVLRDVPSLIQRLGDAALNFLSVDNRKTKKLQNDPNLIDLFVEERKTEFGVFNREIEALPAAASGEQDGES